MVKMDEIVYDTSVPQVDRGHLRLEANTPPGIREMAKDAIEQFRHVPTFEPYDFSIAGPMGDDEHYDLVLYGIGKHAITGSITESMITELSVKHGINALLFMIESIESSVDVFNKHLADQEES